MHARTEEGPDLLQPGSQEMEYIAVAALAQHVHLCHKPLSVQLSIGLQAGRQELDSHLFVAIHSGSVDLQRPFSIRLQWLKIEFLGDRM